VNAPPRGVAPADLAAALTAALAEAVPGPRAPESVALPEASGRVAAADVAAPYALPAFATARVDGFAAPAPAAGRRLRVASRSLPGDVPPPPPADDEACFVMTGAPLPRGVAGVVPREQTREDAGGNHVRIVDPAVVPGVPPGGRVAAGELLLRAGARVGPEAIGRLAGFGRARVAVFPRPTVALLALGTELRDPVTHGPPGEVPAHYNSNGYVLAALAREAGALPRVLPPVPDDLDRIAAALADAEADLVVTTGGTARGAHDHTGDAIARAGFTLRIDGLGVRPGQTVRVATRDRRVLVCLPGSGGAVGPLFALLVGPLLGRLAGAAEPGPRWLRAALAHPVSEPRPSAVLSHAELGCDAGAFRVRPARAPGNGYALLPEGAEPLPAGTLVPVLWQGGGPA
jgi:molybdopterin molybdotransferase